SIPNSVFERALGHAVPAYLLQQGGNLGALIDLLSQQRRGQILFCGVPGSVDRLFAIERVFSCHAFAPTLSTVSVQHDQENAALRSPSEAGLEKMDQGHTNFAQSNGFYLHWLRFSWGVFLDRSRKGDEYDHGSSQRPSRNAPLPAASRS